MSELLDHYLDTVAASLPRGGKDDIIAELRDLLLTKIEAKEEALGRPLTRAEEEALLVDFGHPLEVAARYGKVQHLIGPAIYPFYLYTLKVVLGLVAAINLSAFVIAWAVSGHGGLPVWRMAPSLFIAFAVVTIVAALIERFGKADRYLRPWKPGPMPRRDRRGGRKTCDIVLEAALSMVALVWWIGFARYGLPGGPGFTMAFAPVWHQLYWPILALILAQVALNGFEFAAPARWRLHAALRIVWHLCMLPILYILSQAGHWFDLAIPTKPEAAEAISAQIDHWFPIGVGITLLIMLIEVGKAGWRLVRDGKAAN